MNIKTRRFIGKIGQLLYPTFGTCYRCGRPWPLCKKHATMFTQGKGCFPLCEDCWSELTVDERIPYYEQLVNHWRSFIDPDDHIEIITNHLERDMIIDAVKKGG